MIIKMYFNQLKLPVLVISAIVLWLHLTVVTCDKPDVCYGSPVTAIERVIFSDEVERYFVASGRYYWFINQTNDLPIAESGRQLPYAFEPDVALLRDTTQCPGGRYSLLLIQKRHIPGTSEEEWLTMDYLIGEWGQNGSDSGVWTEPSRIARCSLDSKVCSTSDNYFATMNFNFKRSLDAAFGVVGHNAYFIQDSIIYNVSYRTPCVENPYTQVFAQPPKPLSTQISAVTTGSDEGQVILFDREFYNLLPNGLNITDDDLNDDNWSQSPHNFFTECPLLETSFSSILFGLFTDSRSSSLTGAVLTVIIAIFLLVIISVLALIIWMSLRRKTMRITSNSEIADNNSDSPLHEEHLLKGNESPKDVTKEVNKDTNQTKQTV
ncbi:uncharacterized protein LOC128958332 isoform X2 [Oppia nitens]|uniref:uncharacterized protein LOC128958332 isoform X2 n=1 Tax=Oppia nitens TaxID=1686743 RepID=UPI0023DA2ED5|nr:uncharacterized protein LOC128958332 isoform X2 [Oppia nitens]